MARSRFVSSWRHLSRSFVRNLSAPLPKPRLNGSWTNCVKDSSSFPQCLPSFTCSGGISGAPTIAEMRSEVFLTRIPKPLGREMSTITVWIDQFNSQRAARSQSSPISTSCRHKACCYQQRCGHTSGQDFEGKERISVTFVSKDGEETEIEVPVGMSMLEAAHENDIELEGACEGSLACSTCHVIVMDDDIYTQLPEPTDEENDMLDLAFGLTETSRLGCQVIAKPELNGMRLALPAATRNFAVDGHVPKPH